MEDASNALPIAPYFPRQTTDIIKGCALVLMFLHHFFTFPDELLNPAPYPWIGEFAHYFEAPTSICVGVFAFLTGYFYFFSAQKSYRNSLRKILDLMIPYWMVFLFLLPFSFACGGKITLKEILFEALGLNTSIMVFCWYVRFHILVMLILPVFTKLARKDLFISFLFCLFLPHILWTVLGSSSITAPIHTPIRELEIWFPCVAMGYLFGHHDLFRRWTKPRTTPVWAAWASSLGLLLLVFVGKQCLRGLSLGSVSGPDISIPFYFTLDIFYGPVFVYAVANLVSLVKKPGFFSKVLSEIGKMSMLMWFLHCGFFNASKTILQPILYFPRNPVLVMLWGLLLCYLAARLIYALCRPLLRWKNRLLKV